MIRRLRDLFSASPGDGKQPFSAAALALVAQIEAEAQTCVQLTHRAMPGAARLGGVPDLPDSLEWPTWKGEPLAFLAQVELAAVHAAGGPEWLPAQGTLFFFYDSAQSTWGFDPADRGSWAVLYAPDGAADRPAIEPEGLEEARFDPVFLGAMAAPSLPDASRLGAYQLGLSDAEWDAIDALQPDSFPDHHVSGYPRPVQGDDMELECQLASNGLYVGDGEAYASAEAKALDAGKADWRLLLQLDTDDEADMMWGDLGRLYFWIREQDARAGDFSQVWMVLQCN